MNQRVCLISPSLSPGGSERVISELANQWCQYQEIQVYLVLLTNQEEFYSIDPKVTVFRPSRSYNKNVISKSIYKVWILSFIRNTCRQIKPQAILSFNEKYNNIVISALLGTQFRLFVSDRSSPFADIGWFHSALRKILYGKATGIIAQTSTALKILQKETGNSNIQVIPNPLRSIQTKKEIFQKKTKGGVILNAGRYVKEKNQKELIEIFSQCNNKNWKLKILGKGPLKESLKLFAAGKGKNIEILDFDENIDNHYAGSDIFAFTSLSEGFPNALLEGMAHGNACIAYDCPTGPSDIIKDGVNGYLIESGNRDHFIEKLAFLMKSQETREKFFKEARKSSEDFMLTKVTDKYLNFILR